MWTRSESFLSSLAAFACVWPVTSGILLFCKDGLKEWCDLSAAYLRKHNEVSIKYFSGICPFLLSYVTFLLKYALTHPIPMLNSSKQRTMTIPLPSPAQCGHQEHCSWCSLQGMSLCVHHFDPACSSSPMPPSHGAYHLPTRDLFLHVCLSFLSVCSFLPP